MKKYIALSLIALAALSASAQITITFNCQEVPDTIACAVASIEDLAKGQRMSQSEMFPIAVTGNRAVIPVADKDSYYVLAFTPEDNLDLYASPADKVLITVDSLFPLKASASGSPIVNAMEALSKETEPILDEYSKVMAGGEGDVDDLYEQYVAVMKRHIAENPAGEDAAYALQALQGEEYLDGLAAIEAAGSQSILLPLLRANAEQIKEQVAKQKRQAGLEGAQAPDFTLKNLEGKDVSLSDFRGKWVIVDFWGSWCKWCIKGFPELKEAYKKYEGKLEVIGVDCGDTEDQWREAVERFQLPWVQVYNDNRTGGVLAAYEVQGYPTKVIIDPEGKIAAIITGEDPTFYTTLATLINQ